MNALDYDLCAFSPDGRYVAAAVSDRLIVKKYPFAACPYATAVAAHDVDRLQWNGSSERVLCAQLGGGTVHVYDVRARRWTHVVERGYFGFVAAEWMGRWKILLTLEFHAALAVYNLSDSSVVYVENPKPTVPAAFDGHGERAYVVSTTNGREKLLMVRSRSVNRVICIEDVTGPCEGLSKSPDDGFLCVFNRQKLAVLCFLSGDIIASFECSLSLNTVNWASDGQHLALGCSYGRVIVLASSVDFDVQFKLCPRSAKDNYDFFIESDKVLTKSKSSTNFLHSVPAKIDSIAWSYDCRYFSSHEIDSHFLCIWKNFRLLCVIQFSSGIKKMLWCQSENKLSVVCGTELLFFWAENQITKLQTSPKLVNGKHLLISDVFWSFNNKDMILSDGKKYVLFSN